MQAQEARDHGPSPPLLQSLFLTFVPRDLRARRTGDRLHSGAPGPAPPACWSPPGLPWAGPAAHGNLQSAGSGCDSGFQQHIKIASRTSRGREGETWSQGFQEKQTHTTPPVPLQGPCHSQPSCLNLPVDLRPPHTGLLSHQPPHPLQAHGGRAGPVLRAWGPGTTRQEGGGAAQPQGPPRPCCSPARAGLGPR